MEDLALELLKALSHISIENIEIFIKKVIGNETVAAVVNSIATVATSVLAAYIPIKKIIAGNYRAMIDPNSYWSKRPDLSEADRCRKKIKAGKPVIAIANFKGGVGKSMIASNLAAYYDSMGLKVLVIDLSHNATLTEMLPLNRTRGFHYSAQNILKGDYSKKPEKVGQSFKRTWIHPANREELQKADSSLIFDWLAVMKINIFKKKKDIRFHVHNYLSRDDVRKKYNIVIIDTPPRQSGATANALCACTHVLVPTVLDMATTPATIDSLQLIKEYRDSLLLDFRFLGVVPSMTRESDLSTREEDALEDLQGKLKGMCEGLTRTNSTESEKIEVMKKDEYVNGSEVVHITSKVALRHKPGDDLQIFNNNDLISQMFRELGGVEPASDVPNTEGYDKQEKYGILHKLAVDGYKFALSDYEKDSNENNRNAIIPENTPSNPPDGQEITQQTLSSSHEQMQRAS